MKQVYPGQIIRIDNINLLILDVDATLIDTVKFIETTFLYTLRSHGIKVTKQELRRIATKPARDIFFALAPNLETEMLIDRLSVRQLSLLNTVTEIPGSVNTLKSFKNQGVKISTVSSRTKRTGIELLKQTGMYDLIDLKLFQDDFQKAKPHPESILKVLEYFNEKKEKAIMVGDSISDVEAGKNAGVKTVGVLTGFDKKKLKDAKPDLLIKDISQLPVCF